MASRTSARYAAALLAVLLTVLCTRCSSDSTADTLAFLRGLQATFPTLLALWPWGNNDYCSWRGMNCDDSGMLTFFLSNLVARQGASLPEVVSDGIMIHTLFMQIVSSTPLTLPASWSRMRALSWLQLEGGFTGTLPTAWGSMPQLAAFVARHTNLTGTLPSEWSSLRDLGFINIVESPNIVGTLPAAWHNLSELRIVRLDKTGVTGTLPAAWSSLPELYEVTIMNTNVTGTLPVEWGSLPALDTLILSDNQLSGTLPPWSASKVATIDLANNRLSGTLPASWSSLRLSTLTLAGNRFCGCEPEGWKGVPVLHAAAAETRTSWRNCTVVNSCMAYPPMVVGAEEDAGAQLRAVGAGVALAALVVAAIVLS